MTGPARFARDADVASRARDLLDRGADIASGVEAMQRRLVAVLVEMWPLSAWRAAGAVSAKSWLMAYTDLTAGDATRLERAARACAHDPRLAAAVADGTLTVGRAATLGRLATPERTPYVTELVQPLLDLVRSGVPDDRYTAALTHWAELVDQETAPRRIRPHTLVMAEGLFGGGEIHASLAPVAFQNFVAGIEAFIQDPDPADAPYRRTLTERQADALDDAIVYARTHHCDDDGPLDISDDFDDTEHSDDTEDCDDLDGTGRSEGRRGFDLRPAGCSLDPDDRRAMAEDTDDGSFPGDALDEALDPANAGLDHLSLLRCRLRRADLHRNRRLHRRVRPRSDSRINVHIDLATLAGLRDRTHLTGFVLHGDGWAATREIAEQLLCDTTLVATLFRGPQLLDANTDAERFSARQRRAIAARDRHCVFPGCRRKPKHCDTHHLIELAHNGPTSIANGCLLCRHHHRLLHQHHWKLRRDRDGTWTATDPHGTEWKGRPSRSVAA